MRKYGVEIVDRPKIKPIKELDLTGSEGEKLVRLLTKKIWWCIKKYADIK